MSVSGRMLPLDDAQVRIPAYVVDLQSFRRWAHSDEYPQRGRISWLGGAIEVDMSPEEIESHNKSKGAVTVGVWNYVREANLGDVLPDGAMLVNDEADLSTEPDLMFCSWESLRAGRVRYTERVEDTERFIDVVGSPDLVVEVVSLSSIRKDTVDLFERYFVAGIAEYWLIDARGRDIDFRIFTPGESGYDAVPPDSDGYLFSAVLQASFRLVRDRNPVGRFQYTLLHR